MKMGEAILPFPVPQNGCRTPDTETGISDVCRYIPCNNA